MPLGMNPTPGHDPASSSLSNAPQSLSPPNQPEKSVQVPELKASLLLIMSYDLAQSYLLVAMVEMIHNSELARVCKGGTGFLIVFNFNFNFNRYMSTD